MILVDSSVWIDHLRSSNNVLLTHLSRNEVFAHPIVIGEIAVGSLRKRREVLTMLHELPTPILAEHDEVLRLIETKHLYGKGIGYNDIYLLAAAELTSETLLWTLDKALHGAAKASGLAFVPPLVH